MLSLMLIWAASKDEPKLPTYVIPTCSLLILQGKLSPACTKIPISLASVVYVDICLDRCFAAASYPPVHPMRHAGPDKQIEELVGKWRETAQTVWPL